ncbi:MAG TPA: hypothetical protein VFE33_02935 [Thermoanaerobaculia bacterium]|nr:hypothetical protein [Thermoanaerobaculia bacterium]
MNGQQKAYRTRTLRILLAVGLLGSALSVAPAHAIMGQCKDMAIKFVNSTGLTITIPSEGHKVKNPGGLEGWNNMTLGGSVNDLATGKSTSVRQTLNIKCVDDASFEIHYSAKGGRDFTQVFEKNNIKDKNVTLTLTNH